MMKQLPKENLASCLFVYEVQYSEFHSFSAPLFSIGYLNAVCSRMCSMEYQSQKILQQKGTLCLKGG